MDNILHPRNKTLLGTSQLFKMDQTQTQLWNILLRVNVCFSRLMIRNQHTYTHTKLGYGQKYSK